MPIKKYKPTTPARRGASVLVRKDRHTGKPHKALTVGKRKKAGRNNTGKLTVRHQGGGVKNLYRLVDFKRINNLDEVAKVLRIEYDPNRTSDIALIEYASGKKSYILAPRKITVGQSIVTSHKKVEYEQGNRTELKNILEGINVYNIELSPGRGGAIVRSAGASATIMAHEGKYTLLKLPSGEQRRVLSEGMATIGVVSNTEHKNRQMSKAGLKRKKGIRPTVKGKGMNPVDHPHGGGEGHAPIGLKKGPKTKWGKLAMGVKTRKQKPSDTLIVKRRK